MEMAKGAQESSGAVTHPTILFRSETLSFCIKQLNKNQKIHLRIKKHRDDSLRVKTSIKPRSRGQERAVRLFEMTKPV